ncbi:TPA: hypothetical protein N0F65_001950, partial [Lagenidium giganteum]
MTEGPNAAHRRQPALAILEGRRPSCCLRSEFVHDHRISTKRQKRDYRAIHHQHDWKVVDCHSGKLLVCAHVTFDEADSAAATELRRLELAKLFRRLKLAFDYYTRTTNAIHDLLFYDHTTIPADPAAHDSVEEFVRTFDMSSVNHAAVLPLVEHYAPKVHARLRDRTLSTAEIGPQALTCHIQSEHPALRLSRRQREAETLVAIENAETNAMACEPQTYADAAATPDADKWMAAIQAEIDALQEN